MTVAAVVLAVAGIGVAVLAWFAREGSRTHLACAAGSAAALVVIALLVLVWGPDWEPGSVSSRTLLVLLGGLAVAGGGPLATAVLSVADHGILARLGKPGGRWSPGRERLEDGAEVGAEGEVLRGGAWIGSLERAGIFATLAAGWPEGVAVVLAVKGVGRYHEVSGSTDAAERFIIGTFASVLWACACAGIWWYG
jgi:hypothetical protein